MSDTVTQGGVVSDPGTTMDSLIEAASIPNLAALFQKGKDAGLIKPGVDYGGNVQPQPQP